MLNRDAIALNIDPFAPIDFANQHDPRVSDAAEKPASDWVHALNKGGESWCGGHHVRASLKRDTVTCPDCLTAMDSAPYRPGGEA